ncbi:MAG: hypothetical protein NTV80_11850, partial [Verrucomicrobia bacterium]|nr:hypothetical protein [Verrucomicrobiota bacterium]
HLDTLIEATETATTFATKANEIQMGIAEELKSSSDQTSDFSKANIELTKQNIHLTRIVIGLTAMSIILPLVITIYSLWSGGVECSKQREFTIQNVNLIADKIGHLSETLSTDAQGNISALKDQIRAANTAINALKSQNDDLRKLRETDAEGLKVLKDAHQKLQKDVDDARQKNTNSSRSAQ